jgi:hypothetical protein
LPTFNLRFWANFCLKRGNFTKTTFSNRNFE